MTPQQFLQRVAEAHALCLTIAPDDFEGCPLYIVSQSALPGDIGGQSVCNGYTTPSLDLHLQEFIPDYRGRGPCMVLNDLALREHPDADHKVVSTTMHELAHMLEWPTPYRPRPNVTVSKIEVEAREIADAVSQPAGPLETYCPWAGHGINFTRLCLHLQYRADEVGEHVSPAQLCAGYRYGLSHAARYSIALADEPERLAGRPLRHLHDEPVTQEFKRLFLDDVDRWEASQPLVEQGV